MPKIVTTISTERFKEKAITFVEIFLLTIYLAKKLALLFNSSKV